ncbi:MAG: uracil-DNA glycosylase [Rhodospirillales bacterium 70-18]|nr:uracil-DNA glycosylase family protein [Rhodospirillales bacterium]OJY65754.1 MAG: uracil-DNA glycosylase [Rhodospirillales bacterium 70-18]
MGHHNSLSNEVAAARACTLCAERLPLGPRPVLRASATARLLIIGQAPGTRVHATGIPWNDPSGVRLREWMGVAPAQFYDEARIAILPMGLCYPGRLPRGGDAPPDPACAPLWHPRLRPLMREIRLTLLVGSYALGGGPMTPRVMDWRRDLPAVLPLPHPSWRTLAWERRHPWFREELLPELRRLVAEILGTPNE